MEIFSTLQEGWGARALQKHWKFFLRFHKTLALVATAWGFLPRRWDWIYGESNGVVTHWQFN